MKLSFYVKKSQFCKIGKYSTNSSIPPLSTLPAAIHFKYSGVIFTEFKLKYDVTTSGKSKSEMLSEPLSPSFPFQLVYTDIYVWVSWDCFNTLIFNILHCIMCHS